MSFQELPWPIFSLFLPGGFDFRHDPDETPTGRPNIVGVFVLLAWLTLAGLIMAQVIWHDVIDQHWAGKGRATSALTYP